MAFAQNEVNKRLVPLAAGSLRKRSPRSGAHSRLIAAVVLKVNDQPKRPRSALVRLGQSNSFSRVPLGSLVVTVGQAVVLQRSPNTGSAAKRHFTIVDVVSSSSAQHTTPHRLDDLAREIHVDVHDLFEDVRAAVAHVPSAPKVYSDLDDEAVHALRAGGLALGEVPPPAERASTWTALEKRKLFRESVSPEQVARQTGTTVDELLRAVADRHLLSMTLDGELRLPGYQFREDGAPVAGLDSVTAALPEGLHPVAAMRFLTMPNPDLEVAGQPVSPVEWLRRGLDPLPVVDLANDIALGQ